MIVPKTGLGKTFLDRGNSIFGCKTLLFAALIALSCLQAAVAQSQPKTPAQALLGNISGTVVDRSGAVVAGARLTLYTGVLVPWPGSVLRGEWAIFFANIHPGSFQIIVTSAGFAAQPVSGVLVAGETYIVPSIVLAVATALTEALAHGVVGIVWRKLLFVQNAFTLGAISRTRPRSPPSAAMCSYPIPCGRREFGSKSRSYCGSWSWNAAPCADRQAR